MRRYGVHMGTIAIPPSLFHNWSVELLTPILAQGIWLVTPSLGPLQLELKHYEVEGTFGDLIFPRIAQRGVISSKPT